MAWHIESTKQLNSSILSALFSNDIAGIHIPQFIIPDICRKITQKVLENDVERYIDDPEMGRIGITQTEHYHDLATKRLYFAKVPNAEKVRREVLKESGDLLLQVMDTIQAVWEGKAEVAFEERLQLPYFAGLIRVIARTLLHFDWAPHDAKDWTIDQISAQLAWNIYLQIGEYGGYTKVYRHPWCETDEHRRVPGSYTYDSNVVEGSECVEIHPKPGDLVIFNSRNFHEVSKTEGSAKRISISSFIGLVEPDKRLLFWS